MKHSFTMDSFMSMYVAVFLISAGSFQGVKTSEEVPEECGVGIQYLEKADRCCKDNPFESIFGIKDVGIAIEKCSKKHRVPGRMTQEEKINLFECIFHCGFEELGLIVKDTKIDAKTVLDIVTGVNMSADWKDVFEKVANDCANKIDKTIDESLECKSGAYQYAVCFIMDSFLSCPEKSWDDSDTCNTDREIFKKCPLKIVHRGFLKFI